MTMLRTCVGGLKTITVLYFLDSIAKCEQCYNYALVKAPPRVCIASLSGALTVI